MYLVVVVSHCLYIADNCVFLPLMCLKYTVHYHFCALPNKTYAFILYITKIKKKTKQMFTSNSTHVHIQVD